MSSKKRFVDSLLSTDNLTNNRVKRSKSAWRGEETAQACDTVYLRQLRSRELLEV